MISTNVRWNQSQQVSIEMIKHHSDRQQTLVTHRRFNPYSKHFSHRPYQFRASTKFFREEPDQVYIFPLPDLFETSPRNFIQTLHLWP